MRGNVPRAMARPVQRVLKIGWSADRTRLHPQPRTDDRQLLALCDDLVRLHQPGHAV